MTPSRRRLTHSRTRRTRHRAALAVLAALAIALFAAGLEAAPKREDDTLHRTQLLGARRALSKGQFQVAADIFLELRAKRPRDESTLAGLAEAWIGLGRYADADTLLAGALPGATGKADLFQLRVRLRRAQERPGDAFQELAKALAADPDRAPWAFREAQEIVGAGFAAKSAIRIADEERRAHADMVPMLVLVALLHDLDGRPEEGLRLLLADEDGKALRGRALLLYADQLLALQHEEAALAALRGAADRLEEAGPRSTVLFKVAEIEEGREEYDAALAALKRIVDERPGTSTAGKALLGSADIYQKYMNDPAGALAVYKQIENDPILGHRRPEMLLQMADCYVRLDDLDAAARTYAQVIPEAVDPEQVEAAAYKRAEVEFFRGDIDSALVLYQEMAEAYPRSLLADDAAGRYIMLNKHVLVGGGVAAQLLGRMEWGLLAGDSAAVDSCASLLIEEWGQGELAAEALLGLAAFADRSGRPAEALAHLDRLVAEHKDDATRAPLALIRAGGILRDRLSRPKDALARYETILTDYPNSVQAGDARRLVESLRRDLKS